MCKIEEKCLMWICEIEQIVRVRLYVTNTSYVYILVLIIIDYSHFLKKCWKIWMRKTSVSIFIITEIFKVTVYQRRNIAIEPYWNIDGLKMKCSLSEIVIVRMSYMVYSVEKAERKKWRNSNSRILRLLTMYWHIYELAERVQVQRSP